MQKNTKKKCYKRPAFWLILTTIIIGGLYWLGYIPYWYDSAKENIAEWQDERYFKNLEKQQSELERLYKADTYGGDTPEETWALFIAALEAGDVDLASKYFVIEKQEEMKQGFNVAKNKNAIGLFLDDFSRIDSGSYFKDDTTRYRYVVIGTEGKWNGVVEFTYDLIRNKYTNKWKILEL